MTTHTSRPRTDFLIDADTARRFPARGFSAPALSNSAMTSAAARSGSEASMNLHLVMGVSTARISATPGRRTLQPESSASASRFLIETVSKVFDLFAAPPIRLDLIGCRDALGNCSSTGIGSLHLVEPSVALGASPGRCGRRFQFAHAR